MLPIKTAKVEGRQRNRGLTDYSGRKWGRLTALSLVKREPKQNNHAWLFRCDCGAEKTIGIKSVRSGNTASCGCLAGEVLAARNTTHGMSRQHPREYRSWKDMRSRCCCPTDTDYANYGGRGITVCARWQSFAAFFEDLGERPAEHTLDRIDVNRGYSPENCRWAPAEVQANNKRSNFIITHDGRSQTLQQWADETGIQRETLKWRVTQQWPMEKVFCPTDLRST